MEALSHTKVFVQQKERPAINVRNQIISQKSADQEKRYIVSKTTTETIQHTYSSSEDEYLFGLNEHANNTKQSKTTVCLNETQLEMVVDTGATVNIMDENTLSKLKSQPKLNNTKTKIYPYGSGKSIDIIGTFD